MNIKFSKLLIDLGAYFSAELSKKKKEFIEKNIEIIDLSIGDPDQPTPAHIVQAMQESVQDPSNHHYPIGKGLYQLREAIAEYMHKRFNLTLDPEKEIVVTIGAKDGIVHIPFVFLNSRQPGESTDIVLIPDPAYPAYRSAVLLAGGFPYVMPLKEENDFLPDLSIIPEEVVSRTKFMYINYPNNPTTAIATKKFFSEVVKFARKHSIAVCHDAAYCEIYSEDNNKPISFLEVDGAKEVGIEFHTFSKTYNMTGWRIGWVCGNREIISAFAAVKENVDSGVFTAIQKAGIVALKSSQECVVENRKRYLERCNILLPALVDASFSVRKPAGTFYIWAKVPPGYTSISACSKLLEEVNILAIPGNSFGTYGEGYVRFSLTCSTELIEKAAERIKKLKW